MPVLPRLFFVLFFTLFTLLALSEVGGTLTPSVYAAPGGPPNPQPCKNPIYDPNHLTNNYITANNGDAWRIFDDILVTGPDGDTRPTGSRTFTFPVDFSNLQALFAQSSANYWEGNFQDTTHRTTDILNLPKPDLNFFHGPSQKIIPKIAIDDLKKSYVEYIYNKPELAESINKYTDIEGNGSEKTIYDLVNEFGGLPNPPNETSTETEIQQWNSTWGQYWEKIPTAFREFYEGELAFHWFLGHDTTLEEFQKTPGCPLRIEPPIRFVLPEFSRTVAVSDQLNLSLVPREAQSYQDHGFLDGLLASNESNYANIVQKAVSFCWELITQTPNQITKTFKKIIQTSLNLLDPIQTVLAAEDNWCIKPALSGKEGQAPYCPLPIEEKIRLGSSVSCSDKSDSNKLDPGNPNVVCTFTITWPGTDYVIDKNDPACSLNPDGTYTCTPKLRIWPNFRIPWLIEILNSSLYSEEEPGLFNQKTGQPGFTVFSIPKAITEGQDLDFQEILDTCLATGGTGPLCQLLGDIFSQCVAKGGTFGDCLISTLKTLPGTTEENPTTVNIKERFIGAVDECGVDFTRDNALTPGAIQELKGTEMNCAITSTP